MTKNALRGARRRGLVSRRTAQAAETIATRPRLRRRVCPACGGTFRPHSYNDKGFCCGCCSAAWGALYDARKLDRRLGVGVEVVVYASGELGTVVEELDGVRFVVRVEGGETLTVTPGLSAERIQYLTVTHGDRCAKTAFTSDKRAALEDPHGKTDAA